MGEGAVSGVVVRAVDVLKASPFRGLPWPHLTLAGR